MPHVTISNAEHNAFAGFGPKGRSIKIAQDGMDDVIIAPGHHITLEVTDERDLSITDVGIDAAQYVDKKEVERKQQAYIDEQVNALAEHYGADDVDLSQTTVDNETVVTLKKGGQVVKTGTLTQLQAQTPAAVVSPHVGNTGIGLANATNLATAAAVDRPFQTNTLTEVAQDGKGQPMLDAPTLAAVSEAKGDAGQPVGGLTPVPAGVAGLTGDGTMGVAPSTTGTEKPPELATDPNGGKVSPQAPGAIPSEGNLSDTVSGPAAVQPAEAAPTPIDRNVAIGSALFSDPTRIRTADTQFDEDGKADPETAAPA